MNRTWSGRPDISVSDEARTEIELLRESEQFYRQFMELSPDAIMIEVDGCMADVNPGVLKLLGGSDAAQFIGKEVLPFVHPDDRASALERIRQALNSGKQAGMADTRLLRIDGSVVDVEVQSTAVVYRGKPALKVVARDITARKRATEALRESEERFRTAFTQSGTGYSLGTFEGAFLQVNEALCAMLGYSEEELTALMMHNITIPDDLERSVDVLRRLRAGEIPRSHLETRYRHKDGHTIWAQVDLAIMRNEIGTPQCLIVQFQEITEQKLAQDALRRSEERYRSVMEISPDGIMLADLSGRITTVNQAAARLYGYDGPADMQGLTGLDVTHPDDHARLTASIEARASPCSVAADTANEYLQVRKDGSTFPAEVRATVMLGNDGTPVSFLVVMRDISERKRAQEAEHRLAIVVQSAHDAIVSTTLDGAVTSWNAGAERLYGYTSVEMLGRTTAALVPADRRDEAALYLERVMRGDHVKMFETVRQRKGGRLVDVSLTVAPMLDSDGRLIGMASTSYDITERKNFEEQLKQQALHDALTGLPNRVLMHDRLQQAIHAAQRSGAAPTLLLMDIDRFKEVNDSLGHHVGDLLLQEVAFRLTNVLRDSDTIARLGGDEFAIILQATDLPGAALTADRLQCALRRPLVLEGHRIDIEASIGIAVYPDHGADGSTLLRRADMAMYAAKRSGDYYCVYLPEHDVASPTRLALVADLREAIEGGQLTLHYQPKVDMRSGCADHVEALVRWQHPEHGLIPPAEFIPLAEQTGLMTPLTTWVFETAIQQCAVWHGQGRDISVAINLSARSLHDPAIPVTLAQVLHKFTVKASAIIIEITESALMVDPEQARSILEHIHQMGVQISIDDFGTGYSSLAYLKQLPVDEIKIDRSFVQGIMRDGTVIVRSVIDLGRNLGLEVVAEGVEDQDTWDALALMGCSSAQGYFMSRPLPPERLTGWLDSHDQKTDESPAQLAKDSCVLVVDDNPVYQELVQLLLANEGYTVLTAPTAERALELLQTRSPDLIVTDVGLPGMSGVDMARQIRTDPKWRDMTIIAITAAPNPADEETAIAAGCDVYTSKPSRNTDVVRLVRLHLAA